MLPQEIIMPPDRFIQDVRIHNRSLPDVQAKFAMELIGRWAIAAGTPDGEDSAGRFKIRLMTPEECVSRACLTTEIAFKEFEARGWITETPSLADIDKHLKQFKESKES